MRSNLHSLRRRMVSNFSLREEELRVAGDGSHLERRAELRAAADQADRKLRVDRCGVGAIAGATKGRGRAWWRSNEYTERHIEPFAAIQGE